MKNKENSWMQTYSGKQFYAFEPTVDSICINDIAHALSNLCRYNGHTKKFYSVAEHSIHVSNLLAVNNDKEIMKIGLMHDAAEAYLTDVPTPIKIHLPIIKEMEDNIERVIFEKFGLQYPMTPQIKQADMVMLATEKEVLMGPEPAPWVLSTHQPTKKINIKCMKPNKAKLMFLEKFNELFLN